MRTRGCQHPRCRGPPDPSDTLEEFLRSSLGFVQPPCSRVQRRGETQAKPHFRANPAADIPHPGLGGFAYRETGTVHLSFFTLCPKRQKCQKCARALATEGHCISPPRSISCTGLRVRVRATALRVRRSGSAPAVPRAGCGAQGEALPSLGPSFLI